MRNNENYKGNTNKRKFKDTPLMSASYKLHPNDVALIKRLRVTLGLTSQGDVISLAINKLMTEAK